MKIIFVLISMFVLMFVSFPLQAEVVYLALVSEELTKDVPNWKILDAIIEANRQELDHYFQNGDLTLQTDQEFIIKGDGPGSIKRELDQYKGRKVILNTNGQSWVTLLVYMCSRKQNFKNTTYVMLRSNYRWQGEKYCTKDVSPEASNVISLGELGTAIKPKSN